MSVRYATNIKLNHLLYGIISINKKIKKNVLDYELLWRSEQETENEGEHIVEFRLIWAHECLKCEYFLQVSFSHATRQKWLWKCVLFHSETTIMFHKHTHTRTRTHTSHQTGIIMKRSSFSPDKETLMGAVGICNDKLMGHWDIVYAGWNINDGVSTHEPESS